MRGEHYFARLLWDRLKVVVLGAKCPVSFGDIKRIIQQRDGAEFAKEDGNIWPKPTIRKCKPNAESYVLSFETYAG
jgi:hypothetical protein